MAMEGADLDPRTITDLACAFQNKMADVLVDRCQNAIVDFKAQYKTTGAPHLIVCGGVSANTTIRTALETLTQGHNMVLNAPPLDLCGDNGAMIAWAGIERLKRGQNDPMDFAAKPRWPLDPTAAPRHGGGVKA